MNTSNKLRVGLILIILGLSVIMILPTVRWYLTPKEDKELLRNEKSIRTNNPAEIADQIEKDEKLNKIKKLKKLKRSSMKLGLDLQGGIHIVLEAKIETNENRTNENMIKNKNIVKQALEVIRNRVDQFGLSEPSISTKGNNMIVVQVPGAEDPEEVRKLLDIRGKLEFLLVDEELTVDENFSDVENGILKDSFELPENRQVLFLWQKDKDTKELKKLIPLIVEKEAMLTGAYIKNAQMSYDQMAGNDPSGSPYGVSLELNGAGAKIFSKITGDNVGTKLAIVLDGKVRSTPVIKQQLFDRSSISGRFTEEEALSLSLILRAGAIPVDMEIVEERIVGATLGKDSVNSGLMAIMIGFLAVVIFMIIYYKMSGFIANFALSLNLFILISILTLLKFTLTLPGIAGIILTIGMSIDANVIIYERIKEELKSGKTILSAISTGYSRALNTILDANITTLISAFVLSQFGTGPIKGFAYTLLVGILISMFTALFVTRTIFNILISKTKLRRLSI